MLSSRQGRSPSPGGVQVARSGFVREKRASLATSRAQAALKAGHTDQARAELRSVLELQPEDASARRRLAALELAQGNTELAFLEYQGLTEISPEDPEGWIGLARLMRSAGLLEAPEATLDQALEAAPGQRSCPSRARGDSRAPRPV